MRGVTVLAAITAGGLLAASLAACTTVPKTPEEEAREVAESWVAASREGDEDAAQGLACGSTVLGGVNGDTAGFDDYDLDLEAMRDDRFQVTVVAHYPDYPDLTTRLMVQTEDEACISAVR